MGSSAVIFACGCARLGLKTAFIGKVGEDLFGQFMLDSMGDRGIDTSGIIMDSSIGTGLSVILASKGDRAILTYPGVIPTLKYSDIQINVIKNSRHLHLSSFFLLDCLRPDIPKLFKQARKLGLSTSLDTNFDPSEKWNDGLDEALEYVDVFLPNEAEVKAVTGNNNELDALLALSKRIENVVVKLGADGAIGKRKGQEMFKQETVSVKVIDTVGAGDSFDAGFVYGFLYGWPFQKAIKFAVACGSISTMAAGGTSGQATVERAEDFVRKYLMEGGN